MLSEGFTLGNSLEGISSLVKSIKPSPCSFLSSLYGGVNASKINLLRRGNMSSNLVSDISRISVLLSILLLAFQIYSVSN